LKKSKPTTKFEGNY